MNVSYERCPICGASPIAVCLTSLPPMYRFQCCDVLPEPALDWDKAVDIWNETVKARKNEIKEKLSDG